MSAPRRLRAAGTTPVLSLAFFGLGVTELLLILGLVVLVFGARKIPLIARGIGEGIRNFKGEIKSGRDDDQGSQEDGDSRFD